MSAPLARWRPPIGAHLEPGGARFTVWAPRAERVRLELIDRGGELVELSAKGEGRFEVFIEGARAGWRYCYWVGDDEFAVPDPASRFQPEGPHGPSELIDPNAYAWEDEGWEGIELERAVIYELHIGTLTPEGSWEAATARLEALARLGVTLIEVMPVAEFPGRFGWGYDGVDLFAPTRLYGRPDAMRAFVDRAHALSLGVILDVVYNHFGPDGNYLGRFCDELYGGRDNEWGDGLNFDGPGSAWVRALIASNARYWIEEFHLDGLRLDATQAIVDRSEDHILAELTRSARAGAPARRVLIIAEDDDQCARTLRAPERNGFGADAMWNDDLHHAATVASGRARRSYFDAYRGSARELASAAEFGFLYQGQRRGEREERRGTPAWDIDRRAFVGFLQNHDQVANAGLGRRGHELCSPDLWRALTAYMLLGAGTPMLFQGQEWGAGAPFHFFADHEGELARAVRRGRRDFLLAFAEDEEPREFADPGDPETFARCVLDWEERAEPEHARLLALHRDLIALRRELAPALRARAIAERVVALRFFGEERAHLLLVNLGEEWSDRAWTEPLLAPKEGGEWSPLWCSDAVAYGGSGRPCGLEGGEWRLPARAAALLVSGSP